jgi:hypothetical protein
MHTSAGGDAVAQRALRVQHEAQHSGAMRGADSGSIKRQRITFG